jgi:hypothetical protein
LIAIVELENEPLMLDAVSTVKVEPTVGVNPLANATVSVPARVAVPLTCNWLYPVPTVVPPMKAFTEAVASCV